MTASGSGVPGDAEVVIIGGGVMGASIAFHLAEAGVRDVVLLERGALASGSTVKAAGGIRAQFSDELNVEIALRSIRAFEAFGERPGWDISLHQDGYLFLLTDQADVELFERNVALQNHCGVPSRLVTAAEARGLSPLACGDDVLAASFCPIDGTASPEAVVQGYAAAARALGVRIATGTEATAIMVEAGEVRAVETSRGTVRTGTVVCAAGPWSGQVGALAGVELPVEPVLRPIWFTEPAPGLPARLPMTIDFTSGFYFHREGPGLLFGMGDPEQPPGFDQPLRADWLERVGAVMERRAPALLELGIAGGWTGFYEVSPDHNALIGEVAGLRRFLYATGFSGHGFLQGPAVGEIVRDLVLGRAPCVDVAPLAVERFGAAGLRPERNIV